VGYHVRKAGENIFKPRHGRRKPDEEDYMFAEDCNFMTCGPRGNAKISCEEEEKYAVIGYLLMSIDKKPDPDRIVRLDDLFGLSDDGDTDDHEDEDNVTAGEWQDAKEAVINRCDEFLAGIDPTDRYDIVTDEIDRFIYSDDSLFYPSGEFPGGTGLLWALVGTVIDDTDYNGNKRRLLKHIARKLEIDTSVLPKLENAVRNLRSIEKEREELKSSDKPYREVTEALSLLEKREKELLGTFSDKGISEAGADAEEDEGDEGGRRDYLGELGDKVNMGLLDFFDGLATGIENFAAKL
jgi:hypothetical protein